MAIFRTAVTTALLCGAVPATAQVAGPEVAVTYLETIAGTRVSPVEAARIVAVERRLALRNPAKLRREWAAAARELRAFRRMSPELQAYRRHKGRAAVQLAPQPDPTALRILEAHDPVVLVDRPRKEVVTAADVRAMAASNAFVGRLAGVAPPPSVLSPANVADIRARYAREPAVRLILTEAQVRATVRERLWPRLPARIRSQVAAEIRRVVKTPDQVATAARELDGAFANGYIKRLQRQRQAAIARAVFPNGPLGGMVAMKRATMNLDALNAAWPHM